jgi:DNA topoisomerase-1
MESTELKAELPEPKITDSDAVKQTYFNQANRDVAILCNHQRSISKSHGAQMDKLEETLTKLKIEKKRQQAHLNLIKKGKTPVSPKKAKKKVAAADKKTKAPPKLSNDQAVLKKKIAALNKRIETTNSKIQIKDDNKAVALGTSKINYMDPRITVAWCKHAYLPLERVFNKGLLDKFPWAMEVESTWRF